MLIVAGSEAPGLSEVCTCRSRLEKWRARRQEERTAGVQQESELQNLGGSRQGAALQTISIEEQGRQ